MTRSFPTLIVALVTFVSAWSAPKRAAAIDALTDAEFKELLRELRPSETEPWRTIPWKISLLEAQRAAASAKKPIFIWAMDGHPLGCT